MLSSWASSIKYYYNKLVYDDTPSFIYLTDGSSDNAPEHYDILYSRSNCFDVKNKRYVNPDSYGRYHLVRFKGPDRVIISRRDFCKAWACTRRTAAFLGGLKSSIQDFDHDQEFREDFEMISGLLSKYEAYWDELDYVMQHVSRWEVLAYVPRDYDPLPPDYLSLVDNPTIPPSRKWDLYAQAMVVRRKIHYHHEAPFSGLYVLYAKRILELHEEGFEDRWFDMWDKWKPDPVKYQLYQYPRDIGIGEDELQLKKKSQCVKDGELSTEL
ncbi:hypothetical protein IAR50_004921 [Cryptococcus sp. DSM 104548]